MEQLHAPNPIDDPLFNLEMEEAASRVYGDFAAEQAAAFEAELGAPTVTEVRTGAGVYVSSGLGHLQEHSREEARDLGEVGANGRIVGRTSMYDAMARLELERVDAEARDEDKKKKK